MPQTPLDKSSKTGEPELPEAMFLRKIEKKSFQSQIN